jgi:hypothetical protein
MLSERLPGGTVVEDGSEPTGTPAIVAMRGALEAVTDEALAEARVVVLLDPDEAERLRAVRLLAGRNGTRLEVIPSLATIAGSTPCSSSSRSAAASSTPTPTSCRGNDEPTSNAPIRDRVQRTGSAWHGRHRSLGRRWAS